MCLIFFLAMLFGFSHLFSSIRGGKKKKSVLGQQRDIFSNSTHLNLRPIGKLIAVDKPTTSSAPLDGNTAGPYLSHHHPRPSTKKAVLCPFNRIHSRGRSRLISRNTPEQRASAIFSGSPSLALAWKTLSENSLFPLATVERTVCLASIPRGRDPVGLPTPLSAVLTVGAFGPVVCRRPRSVRFVTRPHAEDDVLKVTGS